MYLHKLKTDVLHFCVFNSPAAEHSWIPIIAYLHHTQFVVKSYVMEPLQLDVHS